MIGPTVGGRIFLGLHTRRWPTDDVGTAMWKSTEFIRFRLDTRSTCAPVTTQHPFRATSRSLSTVVIFGGWVQAFDIMVYIDRDVSQQQQKLAIEETVTDPIHFFHPRVYCLSLIHI